MLLGINQRWREQPCQRVGVQCARCTHTQVCTVSLEVVLLAILALGWIRKISHLIVFKGESQGEFLLGLHCEIESVCSSHLEQYHISSLKELKSSVIFLTFFLYRVF